MRVLLLQYGDGCGSFFSDTSRISVWIRKVGEKDPAMMGWGTET